MSNIVKPEINNDDVNPRQNMRITNDSRVARQRTRVYVPLLEVYGILNPLTAAKLSAGLFRPRLGLFMTSEYLARKIIIPSPAGAVAKYCDEHMSVCMCVCLSARISPEPHARSLPIFYACCLWPRLGPPPASLRYVIYFRFLWMASCFFPIGLVGRITV